MFLMVECVKEELQAMKDGLNDVIPSDLLSGLTAEVSMVHVTDLTVFNMLDKLVYVCVCRL